MARGFVKSAQRKEIFMTLKQQEVYQNGGISGAVLKWIAIITMTIDHFAAGFLSDLNQMSAVNLDQLYTISRLIGRIAFPIFAFLIIQGYQHTSNRKSYVSKLLLFALISEIPFDLAFNNQLFYWNHQNIFFTLAIGVIGFAMYEKYERNQHFISQILAFILAGLVAAILNVDYGFYGIVFIFGLGMLRNNKMAQTIFGVLAGLAQTITASLAFLPIWFYNGQRGRQNKWVFYIFYPAHLIVIYFMRQLLL
jgi:hypothetical protein